MGVSNDIRALARDGLSIADIARRLGIRYQHAYNVLKADGVLATPLKAARATIERPDGASVLQRPPLTVDILVAGGFTFTSRWLLSSAGDLELERPLPKVVGVYAFARDDIALYVGVATMGLAKRLYYYGKLGVTQRTSQRLNATIKNELLTKAAIDIYTAIPPILTGTGCRFTEARA